MKRTDSHTCGLGYYHWLHSSSIPPSFDPNQHLLSRIFEQNLFYQPFPQHPRCRDSRMFSCLLPSGSHGCGLSGWCGASGAWTQHNTTQSPKRWWPQAKVCSVGMMQLIAVGNGQVTLVFKHFLFSNIWKEIWAIFDKYHDARSHEPYCH